MILEMDCGYEQGCVLLWNTESRKEEMYITKNKE